MPLNPKQCQNPACFQHNTKKSEQQSNLLQTSKGMVPYNSESLDEQILLFESTAIWELQNRLYLAMISTLLIIFLTLHIYHGKTTQSSVTLEP